MPPLNNVLPECTNVTRTDLDKWVARCSRGDTDPALIHRIRENRGFINQLLEMDIQTRQKPLLTEGGSPVTGALYQIDATIADVYLVSRLNRLHVIGRPTIVVIIDVFSRMIVGVCIRFERRLERNKPCP